MCLHTSNKWTVICTLDHFSLQFHVNRFFFYCRPITQRKLLRVWIQQDTMGMSFQRDSRLSFCLFSSLLLHCHFVYFSCTELSAMCLMRKDVQNWFLKHCSLTGKPVPSRAFLNVCFSALWRLVVFRVCPAQQSKTESTLDLVF